MLVRWIAEECWLVKAIRRFGGFKKCSEGWFISAQEDGIQIGVTVKGLDVCKKTPSIKQFHRFRMEK